jgi:IS5 family transposase
VRATTSQDRSHDAKTSEFCELEWSAKKRQTWRERFLNGLDAITPWQKLLEVLAPYYPRGERGRPPKCLERLLRMYVAQQCLGLSVEGIEDAHCDSYAVRKFVGADLGADDVPDATTLLKFRRLLEAHELTRVIFETINAHLSERGLMMRQGTIVDATLIAAPASTRNARG